MPRADAMPSVVASRHAERGPPHRARKSHHGAHRSDAEGAEVERGFGRRKSERREHAQEVRASGEPVQNAYPERRVGVAMGPRVIPVLRTVGVDVGVPPSVVQVLVDMDADTDRATDGPGADRDQGQAHQPFAPYGDGLERKGLA